MVNPILGVTLHAVGGLAAGSFYLPFKKVRAWSWESYWLVSGVAAWIIMPWLMSLLTVPDLLAILRDAPGQSLFLTYFFGVLWGVGGLTFGLSMRYLGMSLGYALALGFCAAFGTIIPPIFKGEFVALLESGSGLVTLGGVVVCLMGIAICGRAGVFKERELSDEAKRATIREFDFIKGVWVAVFAGVMSACMAFALAAGKPIADLAVQHGVTNVYQNNPVFIVAFAGGFTTNLIWCLYLNIKNRSEGDYTNAAGSPIVTNYIFSALAGVIWYFQFFFYGMGTTKLGREYDFASWTIHMAFIIVFSNLWGLVLHEWRGTSRRTHLLIRAGILTLIASTLVVGAGTYLKEREKQADKPAATAPTVEPAS